MVSAVTWMAVTAIIFAAWVSEIDLPSSKPRSRHREIWAAHVSAGLAAVAPAIWASACAVGRPVSILS